MSYIRKCPQCNDILSYKYKCSWVLAEKKKCLCNSCAQKERIRKDPSIPLAFIKMTANALGKNNSFYGRKHSQETKDKIRAAQILNPSRGMKGKNVYQVWIHKYGNKKADELMARYKAKQSARARGENNPMYGKSSPNGSGNGWSGWYKQHFFRSLRELSFMLTMDRFGYEWKTAENKSLCVQYLDFKGTKRTYRADFLVNDRFLVECKPKKLWTSSGVSTKAAAMMKMCHSNGLKFKMMDLPIPTSLVILELVNSGTVKFMERYQKKFDEYCKTELHLQK